MKTLRETLLARHQAANPKLDAVRRAAVRELNAETQSSQGAQSNQPLGVLAALRLGVEKLPQNLWRELIWPCRRIWVGLTAVWIALAALHLSQNGSTQTSTVTAAALPADTRLAMQEQHRLLDEIFGTRSGLPTAAPPPRRFNNQPRSQLHSGGMA